MMPPFKRTKIISAIALFDLAIGLLLLLPTAFLTAEIVEEVDRLSQIMEYVLGLAVILSLAGLHLATGYGFLKLRRWARTIRLVLAWVEIAAYPIGPAISPLILFYLYLPAVRVIFCGRTTEQLTGEESEAIAHFWRLRRPALAWVFWAVWGGGVVLMSVFVVNNLTAAIQRSRYARASADIRLIAAAVEGYAVDHNRYPEARTIDDLAGILEPRYTGRLPRKDGWGTPYRYEAIHGDDPGQPPFQDYAIGSPGKDRIWEERHLQDYKPGATYHPNADIVYSGGVFVRYHAPGY